MFDIIPEHELQALELIKHEKVQEELERLLEDEDFGAENDLQILEKLIEEELG